MQDRLWCGLRFNALRLWLPLEPYTAAEGERNVDRAFTVPYLDLVRGAQARGVTSIIVSGDTAPAYMTERRTVRDGHGKLVEKNVLRREMVSVHAAAVADYVRDVRDRHGIAIEAVTLQNEPHVSAVEPGKNRLFYNPELFVEGVKALRAALDGRGLTDVKVVGPEVANADGVAERFLGAARADAEAWDALAGISTHSYNMAANAAMYDATGRGTGAAPKEYWQTEASTVGFESAGDAERGASLSARFLNDVNHGVTHWFHFIGFHDDDPADNGTRILKYDPDDPADTWLTTFTKYHYFQQLTGTFDIGSTFRKVDSSLEGDMGWTYGRKPRVVASVARNPDKTWAVAVVNYTSDGVVANTAFERDNAGHAAEAFKVTLVIEELTGTGTRTMQVHTSGPSGGQLLENRDRGAVLMVDGRVTVTVMPLQLITLRSVEPVPR